MAEQVSGQMKRFVAAERSISSIKPEDVRVKIVGTIIDKVDDSFVMDDGTGNIRVVGNIGDFKTGMYVRVIGRIAPSENGYDINAEIVQNFDVDAQLFKKADQLIKRVGGEYFV